MPDIECPIVRLAGVTEMAGFPRKRLRSVICSLCSMSSLNLNFIVYELNLVKQAIVSNHGQRSVNFFE